MVVYVAFLFGHPSVVGKAIQLKTSSWKAKLNGKWRKTAYHVELSFDGTHYYSADLWTGEWRLAYIKTTIKDWRVYKLNVSKGSYDAMYNVCHGIIGARYDFTNIFLSDIIPLGLQDSKRYTCDEGVATILKCDSYWNSKITHTSLLNPNKLENIIRRNYDRNSI